MIATTAIDPTNPINYYFSFIGSPTGGTGGADSGWRSETSYTNSGLLPNHQYGIKLRQGMGSTMRQRFQLPLMVIQDIESPVGIEFKTKLVERAYRYEPQGPSPA